eukprot:429967-Amphidinium_carterae.2
MSVGKLNESGLECCFTQNPCLEIVVPSRATIPLQREGRVFLLPARIVTSRGIYSVGTGEVQHEERDPEARASTSPASPLESQEQRTERESRSMQVAASRGALQAARRAQDKARTP